MSKFNVKDKVVLTEKGKEFLRGSYFPLPTGVGTVLRGRDDDNFYNKVSFPGLTDRQNDMLCYSDGDLEFYRMPYSATDEGKTEAAETARMVGKRASLMFSVYTDLEKRGVVTCAGGVVFEGPEEFDGRWTLKMDDGRVKKFERREFLVTGVDKPEAKTAFKLGDTVGLSTEGVQRLQQEGCGLPSDWGKVTRLPAPLYFKVDFPGVDVELFNAKDLKLKPASVEPKFEVGDKVALSSSAIKELHDRGEFDLPTSGKVTATGKLRGKNEYEVDFYGSELYMIFHDEDLVPVLTKSEKTVDPLIGKNVVLTLAAHKNFLEVAKLNATYGVVEGKMNQHYGIKFEGVEAKRWFTADEFVVLPA